MPTQKHIDIALEHPVPSIPQLMQGLQGLLAQKAAKSKVARTEQKEQHLIWLQKALQTAVTLEFSTIPPYLCALWSIKNDTHSAAKSIREVVQEEMLHMALACNMLASIGGSPKIADPDHIPVYPGHLPGGVHPGLIAGLSGLTKDSLAVFMEIERPETVVAHEDHVEHQDVEGRGNGDDDHDDDVTIGAFYDAIKEAFHKLDPTMTTDDQVTGPLAWTVVRNLDDVDHVIDLIKDQGEGSDADPTDTGLDDLAHYYRFEELYEGRKLEWDPVKKVFHHGAPLEFPEVWPMAPTPEGGYLQKDVSETVWWHLDEFDKTYTRLLELLQGTWTRGGQASFVHAIDTMFELEKYARPLMQMPIPGQDGATYGPCFRYQKP